MDSQHRSERLALNRFASVLRDPVVALDFGGWVQRVWRVFRGNFARLAGLALGPLAVVAIYLVVIGLVMPDNAEVKNRLAAAAAASPTGTVSVYTQYNILFGRTVPVFIAFLVILAIIGALYQACAYYLVLRTANGQPSKLTDALALAKPRVLPLIGHSVLAGLIFVTGIAIPLLLGSLLPGPLAKIGPIAALAVAIGLTAVFWATLNGTVIIERAGIGRCFRLTAQRFGPTLARTLSAWPPVLVYLLAIPLILWAAAPREGPLTGMAAFLAYTAILLLSIPVTVYTTAVGIVTYAGLRFAENHTTSTRTLLTEMARAEKPRA